MRIDSYNQIAQIYNAQSTARPQKTQSSYSVSDQISISQAGRDFQIAKTAVSAASDVREDKVASLKQKIDSGEYQVSADDFASRLLAKYNAAL